RMTSADLPILVACGERQAVIGSSHDRCDPQVADLTGGPDEPAWYLTTTAFEVPWPEGFTIASSPTPEQPPGFDLFAPGDSLLYIQGPFFADRVPPAEQLAAPGQTVVQTGVSGVVTWVWLAYAHDGAEWHQIHHRTPFDDVVLMTTLQARAALSSAEL